jgi:hypothetical protein
MQKGLPFFTLCMLLLVSYLMLSMRLQKMQGQRKFRGYMQHDETIAELYKVKTMLGHIHHELKNIT